MTDIRIYINGEERWLGLKSISYAWVVSLAWMRRDPTVIYWGPGEKDTRREGTMYPGCPDLELEDGMYFGIVHTNERQPDKQG